MIILGLTGAIGMGKSTAAKMFRRLGIPVHDADATVHKLFAQGGAAVAPLGQRFPTAIIDGAVDRGKLSELVMNDAVAFKDLERIVHPLVRRERDMFVRQNQAKGRKIVVLDVPLLFETGGEKTCDKVVVVSAPAFLQRIRVLARPGMTAEKFEAIVKKQMPDHEKRRRADFVVPTGLGFAYTFLCIRRILRQL